ncbi:uncharacterized protein LOC101789071 isoform X3 [Cavia porcellus]|nr:uncharacterized protein LOC101789071 isoform X2 [Cavia porcellus]
MVTVRFRGGAREGGSLGCANPSAPLQVTPGPENLHPGASQISNPTPSRVAIGLGSTCLDYLETVGAQDMPGLRRYEVALEAEEEIYWGCFYFFPWLRMWRRERSSAHPREQKLEPLRGLMSCLSSGLGPAPQRSGRSLLCRTPATAVQPAGALKI